MKKTNTSYKSNELSLALSSHFKDKMNLARIKFFSHFILSLCKKEKIVKVCIKSILKHFL